MPTRKRKRIGMKGRKLFKRRKVTRKRRRPRIARGIFGKTYKQSMRYVDTISLDPGLSAMAYHTFSASGCYDPDITSTGHQPRYFDQIMLHFNHYTVIGAKLKATFQAQDTANLGQAYVGVVQTAGPTPTITDINTILEMKDAKMRVQTQLPGRPRVVTSGINNSKWLGQKVLQEDANSGTASANPAEQVYWQVMAGSNNEGVVNPSVIRVLIEIEYIVVFHEPKDIAGS